MRVGVDTGGTFTDVVADDGRIVKTPSTPSDPGAAVQSGVDALHAGRPELLAHGSTVATNALLERKGARVALVTTRGFADEIEIARQARPSLYDPFSDRPAPLVPRDLRFEVSGRLDAHGHEIEPVDLSRLPAIPADAEAVAVCLLHADLNPAHEIAIGGALRAQGFDVTCSHEVSPEFREYERIVTTAANASLRPKCRPYLLRIEALAESVLVMTSAGGLVPVTVAAELPVSLLLSGPAGGVRASAAASASSGYRDSVSFDMGGTSTDVCLVRGGVPEPAAMREVAGFPIRYPSLDILTIGAGGGSIARLDAGGALVVGPESAGAVPGPACYGLGGAEPTVTDADLVLGRIPADAAFPGLGQLDLDAARVAIDRAGLTAEGIVRVVDASMERAVRMVTVERGVDARELALVAFGGAGPLHACAVAEALEMRAVLVPPRAGVLSAVGLVSAPPQREVVRSWPDPADHTGVPAAREALGREVAALDGLVGARITIETFLDCRYAGQSHELTVGEIEEFAAEHARRNGYARADVPVEVVAIRARARGAPALDLSELPPWPRERVVGPKVAAEPDCTVWVPAGWTAEVTEAGTWILTRGRVS
jgi:N-methylhydantoinase A/oxoprolinase/acetone carboxylase beta subunit